MMEDPVLPDNSVTLPRMTDAALQAVNRLMADKQYRIKVPAGLIPSRHDRINPDYIRYSLNDQVGHVQRCVASTLKLLPPGDQNAFLSRLASRDPLAPAVLQAARSIDIRQLSGILLRLQSQADEVDTVQMVPYIRTLFRSLLRVYYLGHAGVAQAYRAVYALALEEFVPADPAGYRLDAVAAIDEWRYIFDKLIPGLYPLLLRMTSSSLLNIHDLFYTNGSLLLAWLSLKPEDILIRRPQDAAQPVDENILNRPLPETVVDEQDGPVLPDDVQEGLSILERLFPEAGWDRLEDYPDLCPYFQPIAQFQDGFNQLAPDNPLHLTMILLWVLEQLFYGLRSIKFEPVKVISPREEAEPVETILEEWILYQEQIFEKQFIPDLKEFTHQIYTQPEYYKNQYGRRLLSNMYSLMKNVYLPFLNIRMYAISRPAKDEALAPFYVRVGTLKRLLSRYNQQVHEILEMQSGVRTGSVAGIENPWAGYRFEIENPVSKRLDALCGGKQSKSRTNDLLLDWTLKILAVLDWWINDRDSPAYKSDPSHLYRVVEPDSRVPAFGVKARTDVGALFARKLKESTPDA